MAVDVIMPQMGESIFEGTITKWLKKPGDRVERDEPLFEISTDKVDAEIPAPSAGVLKEIKVTEGQTVPIQTVVAVIDAAGAAAAAPPRPGPAPARSACARESCSAQGRAQRPLRLQLRLPHQPAPLLRAPGCARLLPPAVRGQWPEDSQFAAGPQAGKENNIDLGAVDGTGAGGRISKKDILAAVGSGSARPAAPAAPPRQPAAAPSAAPAPPPAPGGAVAHPALENAVPRERIYFGSYEAQPMSVMRQRIAEHMVVSKRVSPHVYSIDEADMTRIAKIRERRKRVRSQYGTKLTFMPFFVRACVEGPARLSRP